MTRFVLIANRGTPRCEAFVRAAREAGVEPEVVPWAEVIPAGGCLDHLPAFDTPAIVRLESPGKDDTATRLLLTSGGLNAPASIPKGLLLRPGLQHLGFSRTLAGLRQSFDARPHLRPTACPLAVARMFDKTAALADLTAAGVPVPDTFAPADPPDGVFEQLRERRWPTAYLKLNTGAAAVGIVAVRWGGSEWEGTTTLLRRGERFFNTRKLQAVRGSELRECVRFLLREGLHVQRGLPHAQLFGQNADLRVVCVRGEPVATVFRLSPHPMTNLHLGGRRGEWAACRAAIPARHWLDALDSATAAAGCFASDVCGVDVLFEPGFARHAVLEVNAFGDFFPGVTDPAGRSLHQLQLVAIIAG